MRYGEDRIEMEVNGKETDSDEKVKNLQIFLRQSGYSTDNNSGKMDLSTLHALRKYQSAKNIGQTGRVDLRTQITIASDLSK